VALTLFLTVSCSRWPFGGLVRVAILPAQVANGDPSLAWTSAALPVVLLQDLSTCKRLVPILVPDESYARQTSAQRVIRTSLDNRNGKLVLKATVTDLKTQKDVDEYNVESQRADSFIDVSNRLAKKLASDATPFSTKSDAALRDFVNAFTEKGHKQAEALNHAIGTDHNFGLAYLAFIQAVARQDPRFTQKLINDASSHRDQFTPLDAARYQLLIGRLSGAPPKQLAESASAVLAIAPRDMGAMMALAQLRLADNKTTEAISTLHDALDADPLNLQARQLLAAAFLNTKREDAAVHTLEELRALHPDDQSALRSLGELQFSIGRFSDAAKTFQQSNDPGAHIFVAICRLLDGDPAAAQAEFDKYAATRGDDPTLPLSKATWLAFTGNRAKAVATFTGSSYPSPSLKSLALTEAAVLDVVSHDQGTAAELAAEATKLAEEPYPKAYALLASLMAHAYDTPDQIAAALAASGLDPAAQSIASGYVYYVGAQYALALPAWQKELAANPTDVRAQILRSACLYHLKRLDEAMKDAPRLLMPALNGQDPFAAFVFGEMLKVRAAISHQDGHAALAEKLDKDIAAYKF
jgi:tetratricopeptide (TPR) repeat protein